MDKRLFILILEGGDEGEGVGREVVVEGEVVAEFHEKATEEIRADVVVSVGLYAPCVGILFGHWGLVLDDVFARTLLKQVAEFGTLLVFEHEAELHGIKNHLSPVRTAVCSFVALGCHLDLTAGLAAHGDASSDSADDIFVLELHQLEQLLATFKSYSVNHKRSGCKIAEQPPLIFNLANGDALGYWVRLNAVVLGIILLDEISYAIETHRFTSVIESAISLFLASTCT